MITTGSDADVLDDSQVVFGEVGEGMEEALGNGFYFVFFKFIRIFPRISVIFF